MSDNVGTISYTIDADTAPLLQAERVADKSTTAIAKDFDKVGKAAKNASTQITKTAKGVKTGLSGMGRSAGQAGIQFQQFIGQVQGGQSAMLALSQQSADLGFVLGAPLLGAIVGIGASLVGILLPSLLESSEAAKEFKFEVSEVAKELDNLGDLSKAQVAVAITDTSKSMDELSKEAKEASKDIAKLNKQLDTGRKKSGRGSTRLLNEKEKKEIQSQLDQEQANLDKINQEYKKQSDLLVKLSENKKGFSKEEQKSISDADKLTSSLKGQIIALEEGKKAAFEYATAQQLGLKDGEMIPPNLQAQINKIFELEAVKDAAAKKERDRLKLSKSNRLGDIGLTSGQASEKRYEMEQELLDRAINNKLLSEEAYLARSAELKRQHNEDMSKLNKEQESSQKLITGAVLGFVASSTAALMQGMDEQSGAYKALFAIQKASAIASTIINAEAAATSAMASVPGSGGIALASVVRGLGYASAGIIAGTAIAGAREHGGPVSAGGMYRMGEGNKPEVLQTGQGMFAVPGDSGRVFNQNQLDQIGGGGTQVSVSVVNNMGGTAQVSTSQSDDGRIVNLTIDAIAGQIASNNGKIPKALKQHTTTQMRASR